MKTSDYNLFKMKEDNRPINTNHVKKLIESIKQHNDLHLHPIIVNPDMEIIDGQHRLMAARKLDEPIYYLIDENYDPLKMVLFNNSRFNWKADHYLNYYAHHGYSDYIQLKKFEEDTKLPLHCLFIWVNNKSNRQYADFKEGRFKFSLNKRCLEAIVNAKKFMKILEEYRVKPAHIAKSQALHAAMKQFFMHDLIEADQFFECFEVASHLFHYCTLSEAYLENLVEIYNFKKKNRLKIQKNGIQCDIVE